MYGLSKETELGFLLERELMQVCIGIHQVILRFDGSVTLSLECECQVLPQHPNWSAAFCSPNAEALLCFLGSAIVETNTSHDGELAILFSNGGSLLIRDSNLDAESYEITGPTQQIIV